MTILNPIRAAALAVFLAAPFAVWSDDSDPPSPGEPKTPADAAAAGEQPTSEKSAPRPKFVKKAKDAKEPADKSAQPKSTKPDEAPTVEERAIPSPDDEPAIRPEDKKLFDLLGRNLEDVAKESDPLLRAGDKMRAVEERLARHEGTGETIALQESILKDLEELLKQAQEQSKKNAQRNQAKKQQKSSRNQKQQQARNQPSQRPSSRPMDEAGKGTPERVETGAINVIKDVWGHLSRLDREQMSQYAKESFLPAYRELLERYYSDIAAESKKSGGR